MTGPSVTLRDVEKKYPDSDLIYSDFNLTVKPGEVMSVFGAVGCGKTTLLKLIAGLEEPSGNEGSVKVGGCEPARTRIGFVFQAVSESLFPWRTAAENVAFALEVGPNIGTWDQLRPGIPFATKLLSRLLPIGIQERLSACPCWKDKETTVRAKGVLKSVGFDMDYANRYPLGLSGGQAQLVALARAIAPEPGLLLLDEPFNNLDYGARLALEKHLWKWWTAKQGTVVFVTHDPDTAIALGTRLIVLSAEHPTHVVKDLELDLPLERDFGKITVSERFVALKKELLQHVSPGLAAVQPTTDLAS
jgi:NitT/TauT family transport system ATP-binding protein